MGRCKACGRLGAKTCPTAGDAYCQDCHAVRCPHRTEARIFRVNTSSIQRCPDQRMDVPHYRDDGSCLHFDNAESVGAKAKQARAVMGTLRNILGGGSG